MVMVQGQEVRLPAAIAAVLGAGAVAAGAYAAHGLAKVRDAHAVGLWQTASLYQMIHAVAVIAILAAAPSLAARWARGAAWLMVAGMVLFGGALYGLGWWGPSALGAVAPLGGSSFILGWLALAVALLRGRS